MSEEPNWEFGGGGEGSCQPPRRLTSAWDLGPRVCSPSCFLSWDSSQPASGGGWRKSPIILGVGWLTAAADTLLSLWMGVGLRDQRRIWLPLV